MRKFSTLAILLAATVFLVGARLPPQGPLPQPRPDAAPVTSPIAPSSEKAEPPTPEEVPAPQPKPDIKEPEAPASGQIPTPQTAPAKPEPSEPMQGPPLPPDMPQSPPTPAEEDKPPAEPTLEEQNLTIEPESDAAHAECTTALKALGVVFRQAPRIDDGNGCGIDKPIIVSEALPGITLKPEATIRCPAALALARWIKESVIPAASAALPEQGRITAVNQATAYMCRLRNGSETGKISEHARGNAIDIVSFHFEMGEDVAVRSRREDPTLTGAFQRTVSAAGCLYFTTVLDPESDAAHETHFHLDVIERKGGYRYCH
ncbi:extensin-like domain-containing protein [Rhizobium bangladeshense]|uniref:Extensin family protein n=1 Tax=Rhizobium bangladeshense TaxID=1138189 RepID=A0ABS7LBJ2_9HYPH|nr:extensin family protein [Rhizobium bangladeshense]MBX4866617.1 extensin [Rhizobium bangladeshense]MBX4873419.1 extensin [Rhizobium bangladeshense]MBX4883332.1 extensin [Rhizobium bangladeshense]MBX4894267.1 extensin [Rhizobium bangladeshense]MBX4900219.1 extensin [Rhizobium bangladeshense]